MDALYGNEQEQETLQQQYREHKARYDETFNRIFLETLETMAKQEKRIEDLEVKVRQLEESLRTQ